MYLSDLSFNIKYLCRRERRTTAAAADERK
jgi:hypothetical protein